MQEFKSNVSACYLGHFNIYMHKRPDVWVRDDKSFHLD